MMASRNSIRFALACVLALGGATAIAGSNTPAGDQDVAQILQVQHALRDQLDKRHGQYSNVSAEARQKVEQAQDKVFRMLEGVTSLEQMNADQRVALYNAQEQIRTTLLAKEGDRRICHRERKTGSNMIEVRCETVSDRERDAKNAQKFMIDQPHQYQQAGG